LDTVTLERVLDEASIALGQVALLGQVIAPLVHRIGEAWRVGDLKVAHEHHATAVIRTFLGHSSRALAIHPAAPALLVTTPAGQLHELGAVMVAACASAHGWRVVYLGPSLPADEIVGAARQSGVRAVALSLVHPEDDPGIPEELARLRRLLPHEVAILAGGRACGSYRRALEGIGATQCGSLDSFALALDQLRQGRN
jgi:methylmalonyl-CoA mutase cobalamin-binding subunit